MHRVPSSTNYITGDYREKAFVDRSNDFMYELSLRLPYAGTILYTRWCA